MRPRVSLLIGWIATAMVALSSGCQPSAHSTELTTVADDLGRSVTLQRPIERVVTLAPNLTEIVFAAGAGSTLVGVSTADDYPPAVDTLQRFSAIPLDFEAITALEPDLILATNQVNAPHDAETFTTMDLPVYFFSFTALDDVIDAIRTTGELLNTTDAAHATADSLDASIDALRRRTKDVTERPRVLFLIGDDTLYGFGQSSYVHTMIELAGGRSITDTLQTEAPTLSEEFVLTQKPDVIIGAFGADYNPDRLLELHPTWDIVPAIANDRVYSVNPNLVLRPGPRLVEGARRMARMLHPELFDTAARSVTPQPASAL